MNRLHLTAFVAIVLGPLAASRAQDAPAKEKPRLVVAPDPQNVTADKLHGRWKLEPDLTKRLGGSETIASIEFVRDDKVVVGLPDALAAKLAKLPIFAAGTMRLRDQRYPFLLVVINGNQQVVWFRERDGNPVGDAESFIVTIASAVERSADLLFVGGDFAKEPFQAFVRSDSAAPGVGTLDGAIADMIRLLAAKKHLEFVQTYMSPGDKKRLSEREPGGTVEAIAEQFGAGKAQRLLEALQGLAGTKPVLDAGGTEATFKGVVGGRDLTLLREGERWFIKN